MEDLIIIVFFILASLASFISKKRELRRRKKMEAEGEYTEESEWREVTFPQEFKPVEDTSPIPELPPQKQPYFEVLSELEKVSKSQISTELPPLPASNLEQLALPKKRSEPPDYFVQPPTPEVSAPKRALGRIKLQAEDYGSPSGFDRKPKKRFKIELNSKTSLRKAILAREILDRARAYDT